MKNLICFIKMNGMLQHSFGGALIFLSFQHLIAPALDLMSCLKVVTLQILVLIGFKSNTYMLVNPSFIHVFLCYFWAFLSFFFLFFRWWWKKMIKLVLTQKHMISTSEQHEEHLFAGQNTQHGWSIAAKKERLLPNTNVGCIFFCRS